MKNILSICVIGLLLISSIGAIAISDTDTNIQTLETIESITLDHRFDIAESTTIYSEGTTSYTDTAGYPQLPTITKTYTYPLGTTIQDIAISLGDEETHVLTAPLKTALPAQTLAMNGETITATINELPADTVSYPEKSHTISMNAGIIGNDQTLFLSITVNPVIYHPQDNTISTYDSCNIEIEYVLPDTPFITADTYDLVIIAPATFSSALEPLVDHKNSIGIESTLVTTEEVYDGTHFTTQGRDEAEQIKYFIKEAREQWGARYILLVGGIKYGMLNNNWWLPVRYSHVVDDAGEEEFVADLYYQDLYKIDPETNETVFEDWDSNGNDIFAEWTNQVGHKETLDNFPDIHVGRLPCLNKREVKTMVNKIITYETTAYNSEWFNKIISVGGDSADGGSGDIWNEGETEGQYAIDYVGPEFEAIKIWTSLETFTGPDDVINAVSEGAGLMIFDGHANPWSWSTHPPKQDDVWITGLQVPDMFKLTNKDLLPVTVIGGCHIGQFETNIGVLLEEIKEYGIAGTFFESPFRAFHFEWVPHCWAWQLTCVPGGGSIASTAYTGFDWFGVGDDGDGIPDCTQRYSGFFNTHFFKNYGENDIEVLGECYTQTIIDYGNANPPMSDVLHSKTMQELTLMGDPSLIIGGIPS